MSKSKKPKRYIRRFTRLNRVLHVCMICSFLTLSATGLTLKFAYTKWAVILSHVFGGFVVAGFIHRAAAIVMIITFTTHIADLVRLKRKEYGTWKNMILNSNSMMFNRKDWDDLKASLKWFIGRGERPEYGRWTYWEKFDYFAVFWGIFVIGATGLILWMPKVFTLILPGWFINIATIIHSDEALLATGFIFTVHFFNTHLRPEKFPMDIVIFTGSTPLEEYKMDRPQEFKEIEERGNLETLLVEPYQPIVIRVIRAFGWTALTIGTTIIIWIIYAMLFAYK